MVGIGLQPFSDNSFMTHLATGRLIVDLGHIPGADPYTFTAQGHDWVVQSWLVSLLLGGADRLGGEGAVRVLVALMTVAVFAVVWRLLRPAQGLLVKVGIASLAIGVGAMEWSERPLLVGLIAIGLVVLAGEGELDPRWLLPVGWIWVNSHGSFPIGLVYLVVVALGRRLDHLDASVELRAVRWLLGGILLAAVNPLGPKLLLFPAQLLQHQDVLRRVVEWQAPAFTEFGQRVFLLQVALAIVAVARRPRYRNALVVAVFVVAALLGARNVAVASIVLVPILAEAWPTIGSLKAGVRDGVARILAAAGVVMVVLVSVSLLQQGAYALDGYPTRSLRQIDTWEIDLEDVRLASIDRVGNLLELRDGPGRRVFFDDRFDMFPATVTKDALALNAGSPRSQAVLERYGIDLVLWPRTGALTSILAATGEWRSLYDGDQDWVLFCRVGEVLGGQLGTC